MGEIQRTEVDGVTVFWAPWDRELHHVQIEFRAGEADEPVRLRGVNHLIEHLALFPFGEPVFSYNGRVTPRVTRFWAHGTRDEMLAFVRDIGRNLSDLPYDRLDIERSVMDVESLSRGSGASAWLKNLRYGSSTYGMSLKLQLGLRAIEPDLIEAWREQWFTRGNAAISMTGEPPETFGLELPDGERRPLPAAEPLPGLELPACGWGGKEHISFSVVAEDEAAPVAALSVLKVRLTERLRREHGYVYDFEMSNEPVGADRLHLDFGVECKNEHAAFVTETLLATLDELAERGPTEDELAREAEQVRRAHDDPLQIVSELDDHAYDELTRGRVQRTEEWIAAWKALTPGTCAAALREALPTMILELPAILDGQLPDGFTPYKAPPPDLPRPEGPVFKEKAETDCAVRPCEYVIGPEHLYYTPGKGDAVQAYPYDWIVGVVGDAAFSHRLVTLNDERLEISIPKYEDGEGLIAALREKVPAERWLPQPETARAVDAIAARDVAHPELVSEELQDVARALEDGEELVAMAEVRDEDDSTPGLVAVTNRYLLYAYVDREDGDLTRRVATPLEDIGNPEGLVSDSAGPVVAFTVEGEDSHIDGFGSLEDAKRVAAALAREPG